MRSFPLHLPIATEAPYSLPAASLALERLAVSVGLEVTSSWTETGARCVEGIDRRRRVGFRAYWRDGKSVGATWHEVRVEYRDVPAEREKAQGLGSARAVRPTGYVDGTRSVTVASPAGVWLGVTEVTRRLKALE